MILKSMRPINEKSFQSSLIDSFSIFANEITISAIFIIVIISYSLSLYHIYHNNQPLSQGYCMILWISRHDTEIYITNNFQTPHSKYIFFYL